MTEFTSTEALVEHLKTERTRAERFAVRFILMDGSDVWTPLVSALAREVDRVVRLSEFCDGPDMFPDMNQVISLLRGILDECRSVLLVPLAESIRLNPDDARKLRELAVLEADRYNRVYVPLLAAEEFFLPEMQKVPRYHEGLLPDTWALHGRGSSQIIVAPFPPGASVHPEIQGIKDYLSRWENECVFTCWLITSLAQWLPIRKTRSECQVRLYHSSYEYVCDVLGRTNLDADMGNATQWNWLAERVRDGDTLDLVAARTLKVAGYDAGLLFAMWRVLDDYKRWLVWLWSRDKAKQGTYLRHVLSANQRFEDFSSNAVTTVFELPSAPATSRERKSLLRSLGVSLMPSEFWQRLEGTGSALIRVAALTDITGEEQKELILTVGHLLAEHPRESWWDYVEIAWPALAWYLQPVATGDTFIERYFSVYNACRLSDNPNEQLSELVEQWAEQQLLWSFPSRSDRLVRQRSEGGVVVWVDAMGVEWSGLLTRMLNANPDVECEVAITSCRLPSTTEANKEWEAGGELVLRGLDSVAHHYDYHFPDAIISEMATICDVASRVLSLLEDHPVVAITSDHGLSRFAALAGAKVQPPSGAEVDARGRYAILNTSATQASKAWACEEHAIYLLTHDRLTGGSTSRGEVHGGATPEEYLVPFIVVRKVTPGVQPNFWAVMEEVKLSPKGDGVLNLRCDRKIPNAELRVIGRAISGRRNGPLTWSFAISGLKAGTYSGRVFVSNREVGEVVFRVVRGLAQEDLLL